MTLTLLAHPTRHLFFTGKGGVGKTSLSSATAIALADAGRRVLLVSTDAASNLDEMLGVPLRNDAVPVPGVPGLSVLNIDPDSAAESYRLRVLDKMQDAGDAKRATVREQLSGACTTEIASFDEFSALLAGDAGAWDHIVFDTAPTGHTLRLLSLPGAWSGFLHGNDRGASCLGPHSGLKMQEARFNAALAALSDPSLTTVVLVARPDPGALGEAARTSDELRTLGLDNQRLVINGLFRASDPDDAVAGAIEALGRQALADMPDSLRALARDTIPLRTFDMVGLPALRALLADTPAHAAAPAAGGTDAALPADSLDALVDALATGERGLIMVMGKGGVGKTTIAAALALGLVRRGKAVHLSTTDPAAHLAVTLGGAVPGLQVDRVDPKVETQRYVDKIMAARAPRLDAQEQALLREDLRSPCTEEVAVFHAFSRTVGEARSAFVVLDTAPTGHSLLLMDATGAYHRQTLREFEGRTGAHFVTPLMRLQDPAYTKIILVTLPEVTPVSQAAALQDDLRRAHVEPYAWVINKSLVAAGTRDPMLAARLDGERRQMARIADGLAAHVHVVPWTTTAPVGVDALTRLLGAGNRATNTPGDRLNAPASPDADAQVRTQYAAVRGRIAGDSPVTVLHIGADQTAIATGSGPRPDTVLLLDIGWQRTAARHFGGVQPTAIGLEQAIVTVEDEVTRARDIVTPASGLFTTDACVRDIAGAAGVVDGATLTLDAVEQTFGRLAALAQGAPASHVGLPADAGFAAALLILREFMHHLRCTAITVLA